MWTCPICNAEAEDDTWTTCWRCSTERGVSASEADERRRLYENKLVRSLQCLRCQRDMSFAGTRRFHEGTRQWGFWLGNLGELFVNREQFDVYVCQHCGKVEFFVDGIGELMRGEAPPA